MSSSTTGSTVFRVSTVLLLAAAIGFMPGRVQAGDKDKDKKDNKSTTKSPSTPANQPHPQAAGSKPAPHQTTQAQQGTHSSGGGGGTHSQGGSTTSNQHVTGTSAGSGQAGAHNQGAGASTGNPQHVTGTTAGSSQAGAHNQGAGASTGNPQHVTGTTAGSGQAGAHNQGAGASTGNPQHVTGTTAGSGQAGAHNQGVGASTGNPHVTGTTAGSTQAGAHNQGVGASTGTPHVMGATGRGQGGGHVQTPGPTYHPGAGVRTTKQADGSLAHFNAQTHTTFHTDQGGHLTAIEKPHLKATGFASDGHPRYIEHQRADGTTMVIHRQFQGERHVEVVRHDNVRVAIVGPRAYVEHPFRHGYVSRTYVVGGRPEVRVYRSWSYGRFHYPVYVPHVYYHPVYYNWVLNPWGPHVVYSWGWGPSMPWFYGGYFAPAPYYPTPALWLTDFLLAASLRLAYDNQPQWGPPPPPEPGGAVVLTPEVKAQIAEEVRRQLEAERGSAAEPTAAYPPESGSSLPPPALKQRVFVVSAGLNVTPLDGSEPCGLSAGDIIERTPGRSMTPDGMIEINVMSSKPGSCPADLAAQVDVAALQEMQNQFREQIASGMDSLANNQGRSGLPTGPAANPTRNAEGSADADPDAARMIADLNQEATQTEADVTQAASGDQ